MGKFRFLLVGILCYVGLFCKADFKIGEGRFQKNGIPYTIKAAELHYPRIPYPYWEQRIKMVKALGMNTICLYVFWNVHENNPDEFNFEGQNYLRRFIELCRDNELDVILRPGPYVCAEWEMGGLPWWLLKNKDIGLRENDPRFLERVEKFVSETARQVGDLTVDNGGPIIMIQVENEYGSYATDKAYVSNIRNILKKYFGDKVPMFQCDWSSNFLNNGLDDLLWTMNFGTGVDIDSQFLELKKVRPESPLMCSEFWSGWFDKWGANHETRPAQVMVEGIDEMLSKNISFSLYMTHGGTNWGHWAGANSPGYAPDVTSYDYNAPISESGHPTEKFQLLREIMNKHNDGMVLPDIPELIQPIELPEFQFREVAPLAINMPDSIYTEDIRTMEEFDCGFGSIIYSTMLPEVKGEAILTITEPHDYAQVFLNDSLVAVLDRRKGDKTVNLKEIENKSRLDILVEAMGRINFGRAIKDFKGITQDVTIEYQDSTGVRKVILKGWQVYLIEDKESTYQNMNFVPVNTIEKGYDGRLPRGVYRTTFHVDEPSDTFLDFSSWGKGLVYVNGYPLGRIWHIGPQQTLYMPGCWLRTGENEILVFDILGPKEALSRGYKEHIIDCLNIEEENMHENIDVTGIQTISEGTFKDAKGWQSVMFDNPSTGRFLCLEALDSYNNKDIAAISELYLLDNDGNRLSREKWRSIYTDSEDKNNNRTGDKVYDLQESTYWQTEPDKSYPHYIVIDLAEEVSVTGMEYLPCQETDIPGSIKNYKLYLTEKSPVQ